MARVETRAIERELDRIHSLDLEKLRGEWRRLYHSEPPKISRDLLVLALGYRLQEIEHGGLGKSTRRKLQTLAKALRKSGRVGPLPRRHHRITGWWSDKRAASWDRAAVRCQLHLKSTCLFDFRMQPAKAVASAYL